MTWPSSSPAPTARWGRSCAWRCGCTRWRRAPPPRWAARPTRRALAAAAADLTHARLELQSLDVRWEQGAGRGAGPAGRRHRRRARRRGGPRAGQHGLDAAWRRTTRRCGTPSATPSAPRRASWCASRGSRTRSSTLLGAGPRAGRARGRRRAAFGLSLGHAWPSPATWTALRGRSPPRPAWCWTPRRPCASRWTYGAPRTRRRVGLMRRVRERFDPAGACAPGVLAGVG